MENMNTRFFMKTFVVAAIIFTQGINPSVSAQQAATTNAGKGSTAVEKKIVDNGYFKYEVTGNEARDLETYKIAKENFIHQFPEKYKQMLNDPKQVSKHIIDKAEFEKMPDNKRNEILSHPEKYVIQ